MRILSPRKWRLRGVRRQSGRSYVDAKGRLPIDGRMSAVSRFAQLASDWLVTRSPEAQEALRAALSKDVRVSSLGASGPEAALKGLERLADRFGNRCRLALGELNRTPTLIALVQQDDGTWRAVGHFLVGLAANGAVTYLDYVES